MNGEIATDRDVAALEERVRKLAGEKSSLELVISLMNRMSEAPGLDTTIQNMLHALADVIGGLDLIVYYVHDGEIHSTDINGTARQHTSIADPMVQRVFTSRHPEEIEQPFEDTRMTTEEFASAYTWAVPLLVGEELIGVFKIECLHISLGEMPRELSTFFTYAAMVLKNAILGHSRLQNAYTALSAEVRVRKQAEEQLLDLNRELEARVLARTAQLQLANEHVRASEEGIRRSLREKEIMLKEIHHRVKNNLQIISSLLSLQSGRYRDQEILRAFDESQRRVRTMAMVHEQLYRSENFASIEFGENLKRITRELVSAYGRVGIQLSLDIEPVTLAIDNAIPCGLIANELLSNALKHAFPGERRGTVSISLRMIDPSHARLVVSDDGVGLPEGKRGGEKPSTLGMTLVTSLAEQIDGSLTCTTGAGCTFSLDIPLPPADPVHVPP